MRGMQAQAKLRDGRLQLDGVRLTLPGLTVSGQALVDAGPKVPALQLKLNTDRIDLPQALSMLAQGPKVGGSIDGLSLNAAASGATPATLIRALSGTLEAKSVQLLPPAKRGQKATAIDLASPNLHVDAGQAVSFKTGLARAGGSWAVHGPDTDGRDAGRPAARGAVLAADRRRCPDPHRPASAEHPRPRGAARGHPHRPRPDARP